MACDPVTLEVEPENTVLCLKKKIQDEEGMLPEEQYIVFKNELLDDNKTLSSYHIQNGDKLSLVVVHPNSKSENKLFEFNTITITLMDLTGKITKYEVDPNILVDDFKLIIQEKTEISHCQQRLIFKGHQLEDGRTLAYYKVSDGAKMDLVLRLRGGKPIILFYPPKGTTTSLTNVITSVKLSSEFSFTSTYPKPQEESPNSKTITWNANTVDNDGTITLNDRTHTKCTYLFWEFTGNPESPLIGIPTLFADPSSTFLTCGANAAVFLAGLLDMLGLTPRERDDMVTYWLHNIQGAEHLLVRVVRQRDLAECAALDVSVGGDDEGRVGVSVHRVYLLLYPCSEVDGEVGSKMITQPCVPSNVRDEFPIVRDPTKLNVVEWGGVILS